MVSYPAENTDRLSPPIVTNRHEVERNWSGVPERPRTTPRAGDDVAAQLRAERDQNSALARQWRERAGRLEAALRKAIGRGRAACDSAGCAPPYRCHHYDDLAALADQGGER